MKYEMYQLVNFTSSAFIIIGIVISYLLEARSRRLLTKRIEELEKKVFEPLTIKMDDEKREILRKFNLAVDVVAAHENEKRCSVGDKVEGVLLVPSEKVDNMTDDEFKGLDKEALCDLVEGVNEPDAREWPCSNCIEGEMKQEGYVSPNGLTKYVCNICGHSETYP